MGGELTLALERVVHAAFLAREIFGPGRIRPVLVVLEGQGDKALLCTFSPRKSLVSAKDVIPRIPTCGTSVPLGGVTRNRLSPFSASDWVPFGIFVGGSDLV